MYKTISQSIGKGGYNTSVADVKTVQELLNAIPMSNRGSPPYANVLENGRAGGGAPGVWENWNNTLKAILAFQRSNGCTTDGRVDPAQYGGTTIVKMNKLASSVVTVPEITVTGSSDKSNAIPEVTISEVRRVTSRHWFSSSSTGVGGEPGAKGALAAKALHTVLEGAKRGGTDTRTYGYFPSDWLVTRVDEVYRITSTTVLTTINFHDDCITYTYGPPTPEVWLHRVTFWHHEIFGFDQFDKKCVVTNRSYPRPKVWDLVIKPNETVWM